MQILCDQQFGDHTFFKWLKSIMSNIQSLLDFINI